MKLPEYQPLETPGANKDTIRSCEQNNLNNSNSTGSDCLKGGTRADDGVELPQPQGATTTKGKNDLLKNATALVNIEEQAKYDTQTGGHKLIGTKKRKKRRGTRHRKKKSSRYTKKKSSRHTKKKLIRRRCHRNAKHKSSCRYKHGGAKKWPCKS